MKVLALPVKVPALVVMAPAQMSMFRTKATRGSDFCRLQRHVNGSEVHGSMLFFIKETTNRVSCQCCPARISQKTTIKWTGHPLWNREDPSSAQDEASTVSRQVMTHPESPVSRRFGDAQGLLIGA